MNQKKSFLSLHASIYCLVLLVAGAALALISHMGIQDFNEHIDSAKDDTAELAYSIASEFKVLINSVEVLSETIALLPDVQNHNGATIEPFLANLIAKSPAYTNILLADQKGEVWASGVPLHGKQISIADRKYFIDIISTGQFSAGEYVMGKITGKPALHFGYPIKDAEGRIRGCVAIGFDLTYFKHIFDMAALPAKASFLLIDHKGVILFRYLEPEKFLGKPFPHDEFVAMQEGPAQKTNIGTGLDGVRRIGSYLKLNLLDQTTPFGYLRVGIPYGKIAGPMRTRLVHKLLFLAGGVLLVLGLIWYVGRHFILEPIATLREAILQVGAGDLEVRLTDRLNIKELAQVEPAFDAMVVNLAKNIAERKRTEAALKESTSLMRSISNNVPNSMLYQIIRHHDGTRQFTYVSDAVRRLYGCSPEEALADPARIYGRVVEDDVQRLAAEEENAFRTFSPFKTEVRLKNPDGDLRWSFFGSAPRRLEDGSTCWDGIEIDITERKHTEAQLGQKKKLEAIGTLATGIAHDFNNILHIMSANLEIAKREPASPTLSQSLSFIDECKTRAQELVNQILLFCRKAANKRAPVDLAALIEETVRLVYAGTDFSAITMKIEVGKDLAPISANEQEIRQVLTNLLINARQSIKGQGGVIQISLAAEQYAQSIDTYDAPMPPGRYQRLSVTDNGCGMDEATVARLFEPFFTTREHTGGTGLGLAMVHGIIRNLGGGIRVESRPEAGTSFHLYFPVAEGVSLENPPASVAPITSGPFSSRKEPRIATCKDIEMEPFSISLMFVDDEPLNVSNWKIALKMEKFVVHGFTSGEEALAAFQENPDNFSIALTDVRMPGMSGIDLALALRRIRPEIPIIFSTGWSDEQTEPLLNSIAGCKIIAKPHDLKTIRDAILELCG